ncbi:sugar phosphate isomerase/epimerase family protein [Flammeovirgaceae bacterium SG7u.111]|nr:sugar phosphate isomerase/epimerase family protein [Flammeovirgaceae bacterium SG7u.132]WPO33221.1 sugar phosphate isomerase/epimerase family protein [Flammeovirgaceae bacterium SG7u.111]
MKMLRTLSFALVIFPLLFSCQKTTESSEETVEQEAKVVIPKAKYSLAQWSFNRDLLGGEMNTVDFVKAAGEMGFEGVEYVNQFFLDKVDNFEYLDSLNEAASAAGIKNLMIQVDNIGNLSASDTEEREKAIEEGKKWVDAAKYLGCPAMRINAHGDGTPEEMKENSIAGIGALADYANEKGVQIIIENHGGVSNDGAWLADLVASLSDKNVGSLADFHNWCIEREGGALWGAPCIKEYDYYKGFAELIPTAKGISVKAFEFDAEGNETTMDFGKFFQIMKDAEYDGYLGIEYEGKSLPSKDGILKTKALAAKSWAAVYSK